MKAPLVAAVLVAGLLVSEQAHAADILVTVTEQRVKGGPGCSLQEAIFSANFDESKAISTYDALGDAVFTPTNCVPGSGPDRLILPFRATFKMANPILDPMNPFGPGATPMVTSTIVIEGNGSVVMSTTWYAGRAFAVESAGHLTISNLSVQQFSARGGSGASTAPGVPHDGGGGGGGGMGAGGAAFVRGGTLVIRNSSFVDNTALGGTGGTGHFGGGGGGLGGHGGWGGIEAGGGGGGARAGGNDGRSSIGGDGGGTVIGRLRCGGFGGGQYVNGPNGEFIDPPQSAECEGGGGGGGGAVLSLVEPGQAGHGAYGGGGGGGGVEGLGEGGAGGFGGGGGGSHGSVAIGAHGGDGGFGGGGGTGTNSNGRGGMFGGHASLYGGGGGGAGLGGGIFSDGGTIVLENSTFVGNEVRGGSGAVSPGGVGYSAESGEGHGGAVFSFGGRLILRNVTVARNRASTADSGIVMYKQVLVGGGQALTGVAELSINNSIIAENHFGGTGPDQPQCRGVDLIPTGVGNLIHNNGNCAGVVRTGDPFFGSFFISAPGNTPTLAIASNASEAFNTADPGTSLPLDQRGMPRPKQGGFDIGAYERCVARPETGISCTLPILEIPQTVLLTTLAAPLSGGSVSPVTGSVPENSVQQLVASPAAGWMFAGWTGDPVGNPASASTFIGMDTAHVVIANFVMWTARPAGRATPGSATAAPRVDLTWLGTGGADHYDVHRASVSGGPYALIGSSTTTAFSDRTAGLTNGGTYYYVIQAVAADATVFGKSSEAVVKIPLGR